MKLVEAHKVKHDLMSYSFFERNHTAVVTEGLRNADVLAITKHREAVEYEIKVSKSDLDKELAAIRYATMTMKEGKQLAPISLGAEQGQLNLELAGLKNKAGGWSKISKHEEYINPKKYFEEHKRYMWSNQYMPNYFYMVVPQKLVAYTAEKIKGTGYGVIAYDGCRSENNHAAWFSEGLWYDWDDKPEGAQWKTGAACSADCRKEITVKTKARLIHKDKVSDATIMDVLRRTCSENIALLRQLIVTEGAAG